MCSIVDCFFTVEGIGVLGTWFAGIAALIAVALLIWQNKQIAKMQIEANLFSERMRAFETVISVYRIITPIELKDMINKNDINYIYHVRDNIIKAEKDITICANKIQFLFPNQVELDNLIKDIYQKTTNHMELFLEYVARIDKDLSAGQRLDKEFSNRITDDLDKNAREIKSILENPMLNESFEKYLKLSSVIK